MSDSVDEKVTYSSKSWKIVNIPEKPLVPPHLQTTVDVLVSAIEAKHANSIVRKLNHIAPLEGLRHVKRIRKTCLDEGVQICCNNKRRMGRTVQVMANILPSTHLVVNAAVIVDPSTRQVIASASDQVVPLNALMNSREPHCSEHSEAAEQPAATKMENDPKLAMKGEQSYKDVSCLYPRRWIQQQSPVNQSSNSWHPLRHAAIVAIESSAARDRLLYPVTEQNAESVQEDYKPSSPTSSPLKKQKMNTTVKDEERKNDNGNGVQCDSTRPYLCTGYDVYFVWEPCVMCAMAIVHQRIRRVFYAFPNPNDGALGSIHRLQGEKSLNHHYAVFRVIVPEEILTIEQ